MAEPRKNEWGPGWRILFAISWVVRLPFTVAYWALVCLGWMAVFVAELLLVVFIAVADPKGLRDLFR